MCGSSGGAEGAVNISHGEFTMTKSNLIHFIEHPVLRKQEKSVKAGIVLLIIIYATGIKIVISLRII